MYKEMTPYLENLHKEIKQKMQASRRLIAGSQAYVELREEVDDDIARYNRLTEKMRADYERYQRIRTNISFANRGGGGRGSSSSGRKGQRAITRKRGSTLRNN
jgi:hypothetical protein